MSKIEVPLYLIIGYGAFVVVASLLVGILPPLVNRPPCKQEESSRHVDLVENQDVLKRIEAALPKSVHKRSVKSELKDKAKEMDMQRKQVSFDALIDKSRVLTLNKCPEADESDTSKPWYSYRLPGDIVPISYDIDLNFSQDDKYYSGATTIKFDLKKDTQWFLIHSLLKSTKIASFKNLASADIPIECEFNFNDYYVFKTSAAVSASSGPLTLELIFSSSFEKSEKGFFKINYDENIEPTSLIISKFEPVDARHAFPCFDEPAMKAQFTFKIEHKLNTTALSNMPAASTVSGVNSTTTTFKTTPRLPTYLLGLVIFQDKDYSYEERQTESGKPVRLWINKRYKSENYTSDPMDIAMRLLHEYENEIFSEVPNGMPEKIDIFASPEYPIDDIAHFGLPIFKESKILFSNQTAGERDKQNVAFLFANAFAEFWFGNLVTFDWWVNLWLQEALSDYIKYEAIEVAFPVWLIKDQFIVEELVQVLIEDSFPSSHPVEKPFEIRDPYEIEQYFDRVERSKAAAIIRMAADDTQNKGSMKKALIEYLKNNQASGVGTPQALYNEIPDIGPWKAEDFFNRWIKQANYPEVRVETKVDSADQKTYVHVTQRRHISSPGSIFGDVVLYPSQYNYTWYIPLECYFGNGSEDSSPFHRTFHIETQTSKILLNEPNPFTWYHCNVRFEGYFLTDYTPENWDNLAQALDKKNTYLTSSDRANILHDIFINAYSENDNYFSVVDILTYLDVENDYLPWRTVYLHMRDMTEVLKFKRSFYQISTYFSNKLNRFSMDEIWNTTGDHITDLKHETIIQLGLEMQVEIFLKKASDLWEIAVADLLPEKFTLAPFVRQHVYNFHLQNTYDLRDWDLLFRKYETTGDFIEERKYLEALTYPKLPWLLAKYLESFEGNLFRQFDFFDVIAQMSLNPLGREIAWDYVRINKDGIIDQYSLDDLRFGQMIFDICYTFENKYLYGEFIQFIINTPAGANEESFLQVLELVSANIQWIEDNQEDIIKAFSGLRKSSTKQVAKKQKTIASLNESLNPELRTKLDKYLKNYLNKRSYSV